MKGLNSLTGQQGCARRWPVSSGVSRRGGEYRVGRLVLHSGPALGVSVSGFVAVLLDVWIRFWSTLSFHAQSSISLATRSGRRRCSRSFLAPFRAWCVLLSRGGQRQESSLLHKQTARMDETCMSDGASVCDRVTGRAERTGRTQTASGELHLRAGARGCIKRSDSSEGAARRRMPAAHAWSLRLVRQVQAATFVITAGPHSVPMAYCRRCYRRCRSCGAQRPKLSPLPSPKPQQPVLPRSR